MATAASTADAEFIRDGTDTSPLAAHEGCRSQPPAGIGAKHLSVIPRGLPRGGFIEVEDKP
jgi:hypothetical protein